MKSHRWLVLLLPIVLGLVLAVSPSRAEIVNCTPITTVPATISTAGVYCLTQNLTVPNVDQTSGITITANDVLLDLNGRTLSLSTDPCGTAVCLVDGIRVSGHRTTVRNGTIRGFFIGIHSGDPAAPNGRNIFEGLRVAQSDQTGIEISSVGDIVRDNVITNVGSRTGNSGITVSRAQVRIINNDVEAVGDGLDGTGIRLFVAGSMAINNRVTRVTGGLFGIQCDAGGKIRDNVVTNVSGGSPYDPNCNDIGNNH
jgi:hypothetical protein